TGPRLPHRSFPVLEPLPQGLDMWGDDSPICLILLAVLLGYGPEDLPSEIEGLRSLRDLCPASSLSAFAVPRCAMMGHRLQECLEPWTRLGPTMRTGLKNLVYLLRSPIYRSTAGGKGGKDSSDLGDLAVIWDHVLPV